MSLVNDALRKAQATAGPTVTRTPVDQPESPCMQPNSRSRMRIGVIVAIGAATTVGTFVGLFAWMDARQTVANAKIRPSDRSVAPPSVELIGLDFDDGANAPGLLGETLSGVCEPPPPDPITSVLPIAFADPSGAAVAAVPVNKLASTAVPASVEPPAPTAVPLPGAVQQLVDVPPLTESLPSAISPGSIYLRQVDVSGISSLKLDAIIWSPDNPVALINNDTVTPGTFIGDVQVDAIEARRVKLRHRGVVFYVRLP